MSYDFFVLLGLRKLVQSILFNNFWLFPITKI